MSEENLGSGRGNEDIPIGHFFMSRVSFTSSCPGSRVSFRIFLQEVELHYVVYMYMYIHVHVVVYYAFYMYIVYCCLKVFLSGEVVFSNIYFPVCYLA